MTLRLRGATLMSRLDPPEVRGGDVLVGGDRIVGVGELVGDRRGSDELPFDLPAVASELDCTGCLVIPGNVDAHTHAYSALARGMPFRLAPPRDFLEILRRVWWRLDRALDEPSIRASARVAAMEAALAGTTTLVDHHASPNAIDGSLDLLAEEFGRIGIRSVLAYEVTDRDGLERARAGVEENRRFIARVGSDATPLARALVGAHASFTLSDETLAACVDLARTARRGLHLHVAEDAADERDSTARHGLRVLERLARAGALDPPALLVHGVHLDRSEAALFRSSGATLVHNARSNMNNAVGRAPLDLLGPSIALGTDGIGADMFEESRVAGLRHLEERSRDEGDPREADPGWPIARLAVGARVVGEAFAEPLLGRIEVGAPADLVVLEYPAPTPLSAATLAGHWTFGLSARAVRDVIVAGRIVVREGRLVTVDQEALAQDAREASIRLWERLEAIPEHPFAPLAAGVA